MTNIELLRYAQIGIEHLYSTLREYEPDEQFCGNIDKLSYDRVIVSDAIKSIDKGESDIVKILK